MSEKQMRKILFAGVLAFGLAAEMNVSAMAEAVQENAFGIDEENFEEIVIVDDENCCFKITGVDTDSLWGYTWKVYAENKTDKSLMFSFDDVAVNGYMCDPFWATEVTAGMKASSEINWFSSDFEANGISEVENVVFTLRVSDSEDWMADPYLENMYTVSASGSVSGTVEQPADNTEVVAGEAETAASGNPEEARVIVDNEDCYFSITSMKEDELWGYTWDVYLENRTDKTVMFSVNDVCVNGFVCDPFWAAEVTPGMKANESISWIGDSFEANGIADVTEVEFVLSVSDSEDWTAEAVFEELFTVYPQGEEVVEVYERTPVSNEQILLDNEYCTMIVTGFEEDDIMGYGMKVYLENKTDKKVMFSFNDVAVNGYMCDPYWASTIPAGKRSNDTISWFTDTFQENGISQVENITGTLKVYDEETFADYVNETFEVIPWN